MRIFTVLDENDATMMAAIAEFENNHGHSPKQHQVVGCISHPSGEGKRVFKRLKLLGVIDHSRNGHCWLTGKGAQALISIASNKVIFVDLNHHEIKVLIEISKFTKLNERDPKKGDIDKAFKIRNINDSVDDAICKLKHAGLIWQPSHGAYGLTDRGEQAVSDV